MEKGPFSVEWLAQSSLGGAREMPGESRPCPLGPPAQRRARRFRSPRAGRGHHCVTARGARGPPREGSPEGSPLQTSPCVPAELPREPERRSPGHEAVAAPGRSRTKFSAAQLQELERSFREQRYIGAGEKRRLAAVLNLSQSQIKTWFQNRRMKFKRQTQDARIEALFSGLFLSYHYSDTATSSYPHGVDVDVSATAAVSLHPAVPNPALLPSVPAQSLQPVLPSPALLLPPGPGLSCYSSVLPAVTLTTEFIKDGGSNKIFLPVKNVNDYV
ncbi:PREDICTED: homeobox protein VENTX [Pseudopodoces humilis]|uniref:homeobox protein VENTX n=1 Tax=Pseudopodoces humilis TaxID=181119 RepID=UPI000395AB5F|nr:PREDICTED: homeobox protein VENTX [Pseudopodoces humilis]